MACGLGPGLPNFKRRPAYFSIFSIKPLLPIGLPVLSCLRKISIDSGLKKSLSPPVAPLGNLVRTAGCHCSCDSNHDFGHTKFDPISSIIKYGVPRITDFG